MPRMPGPFLCGVRSARFGRAWSSHRSISGCFSSRFSYTHLCKSGNRERFSLRQVPRKMLALGRTFLSVSPLSLCCGDPRGFHFFLTDLTRGPFIGKVMGLGTVCHGTEPLPPHPGPPAGVFLAAPAENSTGREDLGKLGTLILHLLPPNAQQRLSGLEWAPGFPGCLAKSLTFPGGPWRGSPWDSPVFACLVALDHTNKVI